MGPSETMTREDLYVSSFRAREDFRRAAEEVGRMRVAGVVERRRGIRARPMLPEAEVTRIVFGGGGEGIIVGVDVGDGGGGWWVLLRDVLFFF